MNNRTAAFRGGLILSGALMVLTSCQGLLQGVAKSPTATVRLSLAAPGARAIVADLANAPIASYQVTLTDTTSTFAQKTGSAAAGATCILTGVEVSTWTAAVVAKDASGNVLGTGSATLSGLTAGGTLNASVPIVFSTSATGGLSLGISFPASKMDSAGVNHPIDYVQGVINKYAVGSTTPTLLATLTPTITSNGTTSTASFAATGLPSGGDLDLVMTFRSGGAGGTVLGIYTEALNIWDNQTSSLWIDPSTNTLVAQRTFTSSDFYDSNPYLAQLPIWSDAAMTMPQGYYGFNSMATNYTIPNVPTSQNAAYFMPVQSVPGQFIVVSFDNVAWSVLPSGTSASINLSAGPVSNMWVRVTAKDGSTKATYAITFMRGYSITFNANGATGSAPIDGTLYPQGGSATLPSQGGLVNNGYFFTGWNTASNGSGTQCPPGAVYSFSTPADVVLYAQWQPNTGTVNVTSQFPVTDIALSGGSSTIQLTSATPISLTATTGFATYSWYLNGNPLTGPGLAVSNNVCTITPNSTAFQPGSSNEILVVGQDATGAYRSARYDFVVTN